MEKINPKALSLDRLSELHNKVTLGFKCHPKLKLKLALEAQDMGITLSEYVESLICNNDLVATTNSELKKQLAFYENDFMKSNFERFKNQLVQYKNVNDVNMEIQITSIKDIYTVLINSVKI